VTSGNIVTTGQVSATGNITGNYFVGNGSQLTGITGGNATPAGTNLNFQYNNNGAFGGVPNTFFYTGNGTIEIASAKFEAGAGPSSQITVPGTAGYISLVGNVIAGNVNTTGLITATGNITGGNITTAGQITATGNITGNYILGNGSQLTGITGGNATPAGSANSIQFNNGGVFGGISDSFHYTGNGITEISKVRFSSTSAGGGSGELFVPGTVGYVSVVGNIIGGNISSAGVISAAGNITAANLGNVGALNLNGNSSQVLYGNGVFAAVAGGGGGNATPGGSNTQLQFNNAGAFDGNAAMTFNTTTGNVTLGNIVVELDQQIQTVSAFSGNTSGRNAGQITVGDGFAGNITDTTYLTASARGARLLSYDSYVKVDNGHRNVQLCALSYANLNGSTTFGTANTNSRMTGLSGGIYLTNGNTVGISGAPNMIRGTESLVFAGSSANTGNANIASLSSVYSFVQAFAGSRIGNAWSYTADSQAAGTTGPLDTFIGFSSAPQHTANVSTGNVFGVYQSNNTATYGRATANVARQANQYYFLRNDDDLAKSSLGMLDRFHELNANTATTTGTVNIDKNSGQVQTIYPTGNVTIGTFSNFVTRVTKPDATFVNTADTVTLLINQGATPYTVTMPTGNTQIRYAAGASTVASTANATVMISITGTYNYQTSANQYLITISPEFS
jgi:hypothetical protein